MTNLKDLQPPVGPRDCALGLAIPLTGEAFLRDLDPAVEKDFAKHFVRMNARRGATHEYYRTAFSAVADGFARTCASVEKRGVRVTRELALPDLPSLFAGTRVVTLFAHWRFMPIREDDILDADAILGLLRSPRTGLQSRISAEAFRRRPCLHQPTRSALAELLNAIAADTKATYLREEEQADDTFEVGQAAGILHRVTLESEFAGALRPAPCIELFDGMHTVPEVVEAIPPDFDGLLDLTVCHSLVLGRVIKEQRPRCLVALSKHAVDLRVRIALYEIAVKMIASRPQPFMDVLTRVATRPLE